MRAIKKLIPSQSKIAPYIFISPFFILFVIFMLYPIIDSFRISFFAWKGMAGQKFIGLQNYSKLLASPSFWRSLVNSAFIGLHIPIITLLALILALIVNSRSLKLRTVARTAYLAPRVTSVVVIVMVFFMLFDKDFGTVNWLLTRVGLSKVPWLESPLWSKPSVILMLIWTYVGFNMVLMLAGLQSIPGQLYEASRIDGANSFQMFWHITLPLMRPIIAFVVIMSTIGTFQMFEEPWIMFEGGPAGSTQVTGILLYRNAFQYYKFGYASSIAYFLIIIIIALTIVELRWLRAK